MQANKRVKRFAQQLKVGFTMPDPNKHEYQLHIRNLARHHQLTPEDIRTAHAIAKSELAYSMKSVETLVEVCCDA